MPNVSKPPIPEIAPKKFPIPPVLREVFGKEPRIVSKPGGTAGIWPVDMEILRNSVMLQKLLNDKEFNSNFEIAIIRKV